jgi:two-component system CheB/CheR fusion protein
VIRDPPFSRLDLVSCRNLLIYFGPEAQNQVIPTFHYALRPGGYLFLGTSENVSQFSDLFLPIDKKNRLFRSRDDVASNVRVPLAVSGVMPSTLVGLDRRAPKAIPGVAFRRAVETQVLERFAPAHVVVNRDGDVLYYSARTGKYLEPTAGTPSRQILTMARKGLRLDLRTTLRQAMETETRVVREGLSVEGEDGRLQTVTLTIEPLSERTEDERLFLIIFHDIGPMLSKAEASQRAATLDEDALHLENELRDTRERLQSVIEEYETALEELKSSNEELVSVNEELQSTNEELEASKEELQSLNEELHTINAELNAKVEALDRANNDLKNLFDSTRVATVFLDKSLAIRTYTPEVSQIFNILPGDYGRPLTDLAGRISLPSLAEDVRAVLADGNIRERAIEHGETSTFYLLRIAPYRNEVGRAIDGVVLTFIDVTSLRKAEAHHKVLIAELNHRVKNMLTVVISIVEQTYRTSSDPQDFKDRFVGRIRAMANSYELLSRENWTEARIGELLRPELAPFGMERVHADGPAIKLNPRQAMSLGMIVHELATNASKYGALSAANGKVDITWKEDSGTAGREVVFIWRESDGPQIAEPAKRGFGLKLIQSETSYGLGGSAGIDFNPTGLSITLRFPKLRDHGSDE